MDKLITTLIHLLSERRDGLVLINGEWGIGKTYFLQHSFKELYDTKTIFYISLLGLTTLNDFKDKMLRVTYLDTTKEIEKLQEITGNVTSALTHEETSGKLANQLISVFSGAMRSYVLKDLVGLFIIDDLERISTSLRNEISTYCLQSYQENSNLDYILVGNFTSQSEVILDHKEKIISDEVSFSFNNIDEILTSRLNSLTSHYREVISSSITEFKINNLRTVNKIISKLMPLITIDNSTDSEIKTLTRSLCAHIILKEKFSYKEDDYQQNFFASSIKRLVNNSDENNDDTISEEEMDLLNITGYTTYNDLMVPYCFNSTSPQDIKPFIFKDKTIKKDDFPSLIRPERHEITETDYCDEIKKTILRLDIQKLSTWIISTNNYFRLSKLKYIPKIKEITSKKINEIKNSFSDDEILLYFNENYNTSEDIPFHVLAEDDNELHNFFLKKYQAIIKDRKIKSLITQMNNSGWSAIDLKIYQSDFKYSPIETLGIENIISGIKITWSVRDIQKFTDYLSSLYNFSNLCDYLSGELPYLNILYSKLNSYQKKITHSFRCGAIIELINCTKRIKLKLENSIANKKV
ncbi:AAA family ATPase [Mangrovibacter phragmitis]|uniref:AAA family ATPase n=1 Tax=Mangrovibacter phragmitis TaxID=1691903 RepID=A0A1B7L3W2_9ENTR|nr:ATP-binding protein [Mangrovibacter phragmitis]OAT77013.1 AAA family ATPase [Mangrovibacter phragmitis]